ncbi:MAG: magnesium chelatase subunit D [Roseovarius sp.]|nr:magnesium chelatase subunit D [Roseovarius sp.]
MSRESPAWARALRALTLLAIDPEGLRGLTLRARAGPVRQVFETALARLAGPARRIHPDLSDTQLFGGADIAATLARGKLVRAPGLADHPARLVLTMAERTRPGLAARLAQLLDSSPGHALVLLDEGIEAEEAAPITLTERLALYVSLEGIHHAAAKPLLPAPADLATARARLAMIRHAPGDIATLAVLAQSFGIDSLRAPLLALRAARANAAFLGQDEVTPDDLRLAAELVYPSRATQMPQEPEQQEQSPPEEPQDQAQASSDLPDIPDDILVDAIAALLPPALLDQLSQTRPNRGAATGSGAGQRRKALQRGRPLPARPGTPDGRARIDIIATLRAAAPWQGARRAARPEAKGLIIHPGDIHLRRYEDRSDRLLIFAVDASGSAAMARLAEAKGAVELLLAQAYARRDRVAMIAFRGTTADVILAPTRALAQAKRQLAGLPGGGGTPLASALEATLALARQAQGQGLSPAIAFLTDARANITLDGQGDRTQAAEDTKRLAGLLRAQGLPAIVIDTAMRPGPAPAQLAADMGARHLPLPRADARMISTAVTAALGD